MKVLFVGKRFYTNRDALRERYGRIHQLPWHWAHAGMQVTQWLIDYHSCETVRERDGALEVVSTPVRNVAVLGQLAKQFTQRPFHPDAVVASGDCYIGLLGFTLARRYKARFVFDVYDKYDEFGGYRRLPGFDPFRFLLKCAEHRLFASRALMDDLSPAIARDVLVPNGIDPVRFCPRDLRECRRQLQLPTDKLFVGYFGGMEPDRGVADLIDAIQLLREQGMQVELLLGGKSRAGIDVGRPGVRYLGDVPFDLMPIALASCDLLAVPYRRSAFMDAGSSNKIAEAIACQRPLVATRTPNLMANFPDQAVLLHSLLACPGDAADIARAIREQAVQRVLVDMPAGISWEDIATATARHLGFVPGRPIPVGGGSA